MQQQELVVETVHILAEQKSGGPKLLAGTTFKDQPRAHSLQKQGHQLGESTRPNTQAYGGHFAFKPYCFQTKFNPASIMLHWLLPKDLRSISSSHMEAPKCL